MPGERELLCAWMSRWTDAVHVQACQQIRAEDDLLGSLRLWARQRVRAESMGGKPAHGGAREEASHSG